MSKSYYHYRGSLTTPPCTEAVNFIIMSEVQYITFADKELFAKFWGGNAKFAKGKGNNRATQPLNGRLVYYSEETLEERYETLQNHYMLPDAGVMT